MLSVLRAIDTDIMQRIVLKEGSVLRLSPLALTTSRPYLATLSSWPSLCYPRFFFSCIVQPCVGTLEDPSQDHAPDPDLIHEDAAETTVRNDISREAILTEEVVLVVQLSLQEEGASFHSKPDSVATKSEGHQTAPRSAGKSAVHPPTEAYSFIL